jgi:subtilisin-like proprotein convertase family protein
LYSGVTPLVTQTTGTTSVNQAIPDGVTNVIGSGISRTFNLVAGPAPLEEVEVTLNVTHTWHGDIEAFLTSPAGTVSRLMYRNFFDSNDNLNWTFVSNAFWGEQPQGTWTLSLRDVYTADTGTWNSYSVLAKMGDLIAIPEPASVCTAMLGVIGLLCFRSRSRRVS